MPRNSAGRWRLDTPSAALYLPNMTDDVELVVAGGGLTGLLLGVACAGAGLAAAVVDRQDPAAMLDAGFDGRSSAIAAGSRRVLDALGLWADIAAEAEPILEIRVVDDNSPLFLHYDHRDLGGTTPLGYIVENRVLRRVLFEQARRLPSLTLLAPLAVEAVEAMPAAAVAQLSDGRRLRTRLVAAADGAGSPLRHSAGIRTLERRYRQVGIVATVAHQRPHAGIAVEHFLPAGPFATLPMTGNRSSIVWTERAALAPRLMALPDDAFAAELAARFGDFLGPVEPVGPRWCYPLALMLAERYMAARLALIGEAAHLIHPIAGQGLNLGIRDVAALAELGDRRAPARARHRRAVPAAALRALAPSRHIGAGGGDRRPQPPVLERDRAIAARPRSRPRRGQPAAGAKAPADARCDGDRRRRAAPGARRAAIE